MYDLIFGLIDVRNGRKTPQRILTVGNDPEACACFTRLLTRVNDFETMLVEIADASSSSYQLSSPSELLPDEVPLTVHVPIQCVFAEIRRRNWYRGHIWDFFTPNNGKRWISDDSNVTTIVGVSVIIYVAANSELVEGLRGATRFFDLNRISKAHKFMVIDAQSTDENSSVNGDNELARFKENNGDVRVYKFNLKDEASSHHLCKSILDEVIHSLSNSSQP
ncbi:hypothetical protein BgAZ_304570 [Babesia gibsoni]|uniref:Uncharacterized protein n=1 Tax=Babesia gibsoni TaxID=33632 RepID=A0AAD8PDL0_BABGI|nr:hypothetical protein BgAZ_304570 [Babesia gibsoni]